MVQRIIASRRGQTLDIVDELTTAYEAWVAAREGLARDLPPLILENPNDDLIRALIAREVATHRQFVAARDRANRMT
jgi:hypothetical protein